MTLFSVWAPKATTVDLVLSNGTKRAMVEVDQYFELDAPDLGPGTRYKYSVDGGEAYPDPKSAHQPEGVHGHSEVIDHGWYQWNDSNWRSFFLPGAVLYEMHIGTFSAGGTFESAIEGLDHLKALGVDAVELMPPVEFPGERGYDGVFLFAPHHGYGGPDGLKKFVDACHERNLGVIIDCVYNHLGPDGNYLPNFGPYFTDKFRTPWGSAVNYDDVDSDEVRRFVIENAKMWLRDYHVDVLRLDAVHAIYDLSATHMLKELQNEVEALSRFLRRPLYLIAESDLNDPRIVERQEVGGHGLSVQWSDDFHHALHACLTGEQNGYYADFGSLDTLVEVLNHTFAGAGEYSPFRGKTYGRSASHLPSHRFVGYLQNHDQIGNRALGERTSALLSAGRLRIGAVLVLLGPFVPMLFQGEEWGAATPFFYFTDHVDVALGKAISEGRTKEFPHFDWEGHSVPDPQDRSTFENSKLDWSELSKPEHSDILAWHKRLIELRNNEPAVKEGRVDWDCFSADDVLVMMRGPLTVVANLGSKTSEDEVSHHAELLMAYPDDVTLANGVLRLPPDGVAVLREG